MGAWLGARGHEVHYIRPQPQREEPDPPPGTRLHEWEELPGAELRRRVRELELDVLLINPERSRHLRGVRANVLRPGYGTDQYRQKLDSFRTSVGTLARRLLRWSPWVLAERRWERIFYEEPDPPPRVVAVSRYMEGEVLATYDVPPDHVTVIHNGVDLERFSPEVRAEKRDEMRARWEVPPSSTCLLFMGHNFRLKGLWALLEVVAELRRRGRDVHLLVAGKGTGGLQRRKARRLIARHGLEERVRLLGRVFPPTDAFAAADVFFHLSWHDSFGFVVLEAMACGLPVITTPHAGAHEVVEDGVSGLLVEPDDTPAILDRVERLLEPERRRAMGEAALAVAREHGEPDNFRRVLEVMEAAAAEWDGPVR